MNDFSYNIKQDRLVFSVRVIPKSPFSKVDGTRNGSLLVRVKAAPEHGKANEEVRDCIAFFLKLPSRQIIIENGSASRKKTVSVPSLCMPQLDKLVKGRGVGSQS
ncbi:MAG: DUF167 domain-containing protein [Spirochaetaceae bacterium]|nr:DUF167 domain-containing protein [Spirochaetaceae bacterium]